MRLITKDDIAKMFYPLNERVGATLELTVTYQRRSKVKHLVMTVSLTKPTCIQFYIVKQHEKDDLKKVIVCSTSNMKKVDYRDSKMQPSYDLQFITDNKTWSFTAAKLESKHHFVTEFCRIVSALQPSIYSAIEFVNLPDDISFPSIDDSEQTLGSILNSDIADAEKVVPSESVTTSDAYRTLTPREEQDVLQFLQEIESMGVQMSETEMTEHLQNQLADLEGTNIHSIMASEKQLLQLMVNLDKSIEQAENLEKLVDAHHSFIADVEDAMSKLYDSDQLVQLTVDNRGRLLDVLGDLVSRYTLDAKWMRALMDVNLDSLANIAACTEAAQVLDSLLNAKINKGEEHLLSVCERRKELENLCDTFASKLVVQINDSIVRSAIQLNFAATSGLGSLSGSCGNIGAASNSFSNVQSLTDLHWAQRKELLQLAPLVGDWLQTNRKDVFIQVKKIYIEKMQQFFKRQTEELLSSTQNSILLIIKPNKAGTISHTLEAADSVSMLSVACPEASVLTQVGSIFDIVFDRIYSVLRNEESFLNQFFRFQKLATKMISPAARSDAALETANGCMKLLFYSLEQSLAQLLAFCEQLQNTTVLPFYVAICRISEADTISSSVTPTDQVGLDSASTSYAAFTMAQTALFAKRAFNRYIERLIQSFKMERPSKRSRCGLLRMLRVYMDFAEVSGSIFANSSRTVDLERSHGELVRALIVQLERVASESVKTPREVVQLENYHRLNDVLRRLKTPGLVEYRQETKNRYLRALQEYTHNCMGHPLEKLAAFFENIQTALDAGVRPEVIQYQFVSSKQALRKVVKEYPGKEVKRGLELLCKKVEKHLSEESNLFLVVWHSIQAEFFAQYNRFNNMIAECYPNCDIRLEFTTDDLQSYFTDIARSR